MAFRSEVVAVTCFLLLFLIQNISTFQWQNKDVKASQTVKDCLFSVQVKQTQTSSWMRRSLDVFYFSPAAPFFLDQYLKLFFLSALASPEAGIHHGILSKEPH